MDDSSQRRDERLIGNWMWVFPIAYLFHIVEEHFAGFNEWVEGRWQIKSTDLYFLAWNLIAAFGMAYGVRLAMKRRSFRWLILGFGLSVLGNGAMHIAASIMTKTYTPGLATSIALWLPLAVFSIWWAWAVKLNKRSTILAIGFGIVANIFILLFVFSIPRLFTR